MSFPAFSQNPETITITTYYPTAIGFYQELRSERTAIGPTYYDSSLYPWATNTPPDNDNEIPQNVVLAVEGDTGIGTHTPDGRLHIDYAGSNTGTTLVLDDSTDPSADPWDNSISFQKQGTEFTRIGIGGSDDGSGNPAFDVFSIDMTTNATISGDPEFNLDSSGNLGIGSRGPGTAAPNGETDGNLYLNDAYLRDIDQWLSEFAATGGGGGPVVLRNPTSGQLEALTKPTLLAGKHYVLDGVEEGKTVTWANTPFSKIHAVITSIESSRHFLSNNSLYFESDDGLGGYFPIISKINSNSSITFSGGNSMGFSNLPSECPDPPPGLPEGHGCIEYNFIVIGEGI